jgi:ABC-2 type transport system ATP-binding protein
MEVLKVSILNVQELRKCFGKLEAVKGVSFSVEKGESFSLLGPNGAGKSATINMMTGTSADFREYSNNGC